MLKQMFPDRCFYFGGGKKVQKCPLCLWSNFVKFGPTTKNCNAHKKDQIFAEDSNHLSKQLTAAYTHIEMNEILNLLKYLKKKMK